MFHWDKKKAGELELPPGLFDQKMNPALISEMVRWQRAKARQGTHKAKTRADVSGGGKKPFRQKGTGNARQGSIRSPLNRGGGVTFGPKPRKYDYKLPTKMKQSALKQALSYLFKEKKIIFMKDMKGSFKGKTKELAKGLQLFKLKKALLVDQEPELLFKRACRNLKNFQVLPAKALNVYDMLKYNQLVMSESSVDFLKQKAKK